MKVVHVITRLIRGGADENTILSCNAQADAGHDVTLIYGQENDDYMLSMLSGRVKRLQLDALVRRPDLLRDCAAFTELRSVLKQIAPDVVHTHTSKAGIVGRLAAATSTKASVVHGVHILPFMQVGRAQRAVYLALEKLAAYCTDAFIDVSESMRDECLRYGIGDTNNHFVIRSGMGTDEFRSAAAIHAADYPDLLPRSINSWDEGRVVLHVAALERRKRHLDFLDAFATVARSDRRNVLVVAGSGPEEPAILQRASDLGIADQVSLIGYRTDIARWMARADVCVLSSEREGLPRVVVQYALAARPIVATRLPGLESIVVNGETGYLVDEPAEMSPLVADLLANEATRNLFSSRLKSIDFSAWSTDRMTSEIEAVYSGLRGARA